MLLLLDGHSTHTKNLEAIQLTRDYGIIMLSFPAHTTHRLQPLDKSFFKSLKNNYNEIESSWQRSNPGSLIKQANIAELLGNAYPKSVRMNIALNRFRATSLWPCDKNAIKENDLVASVHIVKQSDKERANTAGAKAQTRIRLPPARVASPPRVVTPPTIATPPRIATPLNVPHGPSTSQESAPENNIVMVDDINTQQLKSYLNTVCPILCITTVINKMKKGSKPTTELTSSPYKNKIKAKENANKNRNLY